MMIPWTAKIHKVHWFRRTAALAIHTIQIQMEWTRIAWNLDSREDSNYHHHPRQLIRSLLLLIFLVHFILLTTVSPLPTSTYPRISLRIQISPQTTTILLITFAYCLHPLESKEGFSWIWTPSRQARMRMIMITVMTHKGSSNNRIRMQMLNQWFRSLSLIRNQSSARRESNYQIWVKWMVTIRRAALKTLKKVMNSKNRLLPPQNAAGLITLHSHMIPLQAGGAST